MTLAKNDQNRDEIERFYKGVSTVSAAWKIIVILPLLAGLLTYLYLSSRNGIYRSDAVLILSKAEIIILKSHRVFGEALKKVSREPNASASVAVIALDSPDTYQVSVSASSAARASTILQEIIARLPAETMPSEAARARLAHRLEVLKDSVTSLSTALEGMKVVYDKVVNGDASADALSASGDFGQSFAVLANTISSKEQEIATVQVAMEPTFDANDVILDPTVPVAPVARTVGPFVMLACVLTLAATLVFVFGVAAWRRIAINRADRLYADAA